MAAAGSRTRSAPPGQRAGGPALVEELAARTGSRDDTYAAALLADEEGRAADSQAWLGRISTGSRTSDMARLGQRLRNQAEVQRAVAGLAGAGDGRAALLTLAARPDPSGANFAAIIRALGSAQDRAGAAEAARIAQTANRTAGPTARIAIAGALLGAGLEAEATALANAVEAANPPPEQRRDLASLRGGIAIRSADRLNEGGEQARGFKTLRPVLERDPENPDACLALPACSKAPACRPRRCAWPMPCWPATPATSKPAPAQWTPPPPCATAPGPKR